MVLTNEELTEVVGYLQEQIDALRHVEKVSTSQVPIKNISVTEKGVYIECL